MAITNIESTGFNSLFQASASLARKTVEANIPSQKEKILKANNRSLNRDNLTLESQNKLLAQQNDDLQKNNRNLTQQVKDSQQAENLQIKQSQYEYENNNSQQDSRSVEKAKTADNITFTKPAAVNFTAQPTEPSAVTTYTPSSNLSGVELGNSFNSFA
ncbi:MAG: hypothetical protein QM504_07915 [Pseudomonadota bacterium]